MKVGSALLFAVGTVDSYFEVYIYVHERISSAQWNVSSEDGKVGILYRSNFIKLL
jgi:hypothetical protein